MPGKSDTKLHDRLAAILYRCNGQTDEFLHVVFDFLKKKKKLAKMDKEKVIKAFNEEILVSNSTVKKASELTSKERMKKLLAKF